MKAKHKQPIKDIAKRYAEKHQIIYSDYHERLTNLIIDETLRQASWVLAEQDEVTYDMDLYKGQVPNTEIDYNKREKMD